jgi:hypothetical protein
MIKNLIDEKYYREVSNIIYNNEDFMKCLSNIYGYDVILFGCDFDKNINSNLTSLSNCCVLVYNYNVPYIIGELSAYYIPENLDTITISDMSLYSDVDDLKLDYIKKLTYDLSLEYVLEQSQTIPIIHTEQI